MKGKRAGYPADSLDLTIPLQQSYTNGGLKLIVCAEAPCSWDILVSR
jgi:hypothetical protein